MTSDSFLRKNYVPIDIEELCRVTDLKNWANVKVKVIGTLKDPSTLFSVCEQGGPYKIAVDLHLLDVYPKENTIIQMYGEVEMCLSKPQIQVTFFRKLDGLDVNAYRKALELQNKYVPHFIKT